MGGELCDAFRHTDIALRLMGLIMGPKKPRQVTAGLGGLWADAAFLLGSGCIQSTADAAQVWTGNLVRSFVAFLGLSLVFRPISSSPPLFDTITLRGLKSTRKRRATPPAFTQSSFIRTAPPAVILAGGCECRTTSHSSPPSLFPSRAFCNSLACAPARLLTATTHTPPALRGIHAAREPWIHLLEPASNLSPKPLQVGPDRAGLTALLPWRSTLTV